MEREIVIWLAGLLSTDGVVKNSNKSRGLAFCIYSSEVDWLQVINEKMDIIGISTLLRESTGERFGKCCWLWLHNPRKIALLFDKYNCKEWFNPRKWKILEKGIEYYKNSVNHNPYSEEEIFIVRQNLDLGNNEIGKLVRRSSNSVAQLKRRLGLKMEPKALSNMRSKLNRIRGRS